MLWVVVLVVLVVLVVVGIAVVLLVVEAVVLVVALEVVVLGVVLVVVVVFSVGPAQTPHEIKQLPNMYSGFNSHWPVLAHSGHRSLASTHGLVVVVVVAVVLVVGLVVVVEVVLLVVVVDGVEVTVDCVDGEVVWIGLLVVAVEGGKRVGELGGEQIPHDTRQLSAMYEGLSSHSPNLAHNGHIISLSIHSTVVVCVVLVVVVTVVVVGLVFLVVELVLLVEEEVGVGVVEEVAMVVVGVTPSVSAISKTCNTKNFK